MLNEIRTMKNKGDVAGLFALLQNNRNQSDKAWMLRLDAAEALAQLGDPRGFDYLNKMMESSDKEIQEVAAEILGGLRDVPPEPILQTEMLDQPSYKSLVDAVISKYPYLMAWLAFIVLYYLVGTVLTPVLSIFLVRIEPWVPEPIFSLTRLLLYVVIAFFIFRYVIKKIILPYAGLQ